MFFLHHFISVWNGNFFLCIRSFYNFVFIYNMRIKFSRVIIQMNIIITRQRRKRVSMINTFSQESLHIFNQKIHTRNDMCYVVTARLHLTKKRDQTEKRNWWQSLNNKKKSFLWVDLHQKKILHYWPSFLSSIQIKKREPRSQHLFENDPLNWIFFFLFIKYVW